MRSVASSPTDACTAPALDSSTAVTLSGLSDRIASHAHGLRFDDLPASTILRTKLLVLDTLGAALAATSAAGCAELRNLVVGWGGRPEARLVGSQPRVPAHNAALANATLARALEVDDVHEVGLTHSTATMVPVALAVADSVGGTSGRDLLAAIAMGIDLGIRLSMAPITDLGGRDYRPRSMSRTYQTGTLAGSLVAARIRGLDVERTKDALGNAYSQCAGNLQGLAEGSLTVRVQQGICAQSAVLAAEFAQVGISGARESLEGKYGWFQAFWGGRYALEPLLDGLGTRFEVEGVSVKPYACCKYGHTSIAAAIDILDDPAFAVDEIARVHVHVFSRDCWDLICEPLPIKASADALAGPNGWALAQFSLPYMVACALARGRLTIEDLDPAARADPAIASLLPKINIVMEDTTRNLEELPEPGHVEVELHDGTKISRTVRRAVGHPDRPMSEAAQVEKFRWCTRALPAERADVIVEAVLALEQISDSRDLTGALAGMP
jgi:2-methylcitrate dehydratase PrpD